MLLAPIAQRSDDRVPEDDQQGNEHHQSPDGQEDRKHEPLSFELLDVSVYELADQSAFLVAVAATDCGSRDGPCDLVHLSRREDEYRLVYSGELDLEVVVHECERLLERLDLGANDAMNKILRRILQNRASEHLVDDFLNVIIKSVESLVEGRRSVVDPTKDTFVDGGLDLGDLGIDTIGIGGRLVVHRVGH